MAYKKDRAMVFHQGGSTSPAATNYPAACLLLPKPGRVSDDEEELTGKPNGFPSQEQNWTADGLTAGKCPAGSNPQSDNLSPVVVCRGIRVTLDNNSMWNEFFRSKTEMILTKQGSRMFPYCRFRISGLQPSRKYSLYMDIQPLDGSRYRWTGKSWQVAGKAESNVKSRPFAHPESPSTGQHWMQTPVSFYQLKLTNCSLDLEGNTILHPMHRYLPRMHVVQTDTDAKDINLTGPAVHTFAFDQTAFMAVTTYQNSKFSQLKVDYNPFAKGLKEDASGGPKLKLHSGKDGGTTADQQHPVKKSLKSLLASYKPRSTKAADAKLSESSDLQRNSTSNDGQSSAKASDDSSCGNSSSAQKLFSELIREAHISLHRCNLNQLDADAGSEQSNNKTTALKSNGTCEPTGNGGPANSGETKRKVREDDSPLNSMNSKDAVRTNCSELSNAGLVGSCSSSADSDPQLKAKAPSEAKLKQHKRPLPLPALARFLRQHSSKSRLAKSRPDSPPARLPPECRSCSECPPSDHGTEAKNLGSDDTTPDPPQATHSEPRLHPEEVLNVTGLAAETAGKPSCPSCSNTVSSTDPEGPDGFLKSDSVAKSGSPDGTPALPDSYQLSLVTHSPASSLAVSLVPLPLHNAELPAGNTSLSPPKSEPPLLDPELSSFGFDPLSPTSSPEPLPSLPVSFGLELHSAASPVTLKAASPDEHGEDSSVFKWHTVLPLTEAYLEPSFTTFQPAPQTLPSASVTSPLLPLQTPSYPELQTPYPSNFTSAPDLAPSFEDSKQPLPFPVELSPLTLQMTLSPSFSSLDGDGLSPTPSIADLVHFFSTNDDLGMGVEFSNTEVVAVPCAPLVIEEANEEKLPQQVLPIPIDKPCRNKCRRQKLVNEEDEKMDASTYAKMQPNLEEVEEQLFISFTSKEALRLHVADFSDGTASQPQTTPEGHQQLTAVTPENAEGLEEPIASFEKILLKDLKQMRHRQVIHPVLQEVGLKMNLLDPTLAIDLQYLGVRLPIPLSGVPLEPLPPTQGVSAAFVSRTGKTTDLTQIKGWREKFPPLEATSAAALVNHEAGPSSDLPKNLSAFCSDMLDEYLENEGKLIDQRDSTFAQPPAEPVVYQLPTRSTSYVRTLGSVLKKQTADSPTSDLISRFIPPSKRPKLSLREAKTFRRRRGPKHTKPDPAQQVQDKSTGVPNNPPVQIPVPPLLENTNSVTKPHPSKRHQQKVHFDHTKLQTWSSQPKQRRKLKPKTLSQTLSPAEPEPPLTCVSQDMAPLESDSELRTPDQSEKDKRPVMTRALLRQKDLEDGVLWEGRPRTSITEDRASVALTSLFTLKGFVRENPTAPIQWVQRPAPHCLNESCRLGCICSSLSYCSRISHCGRAACMFGCSCLKQKVVLLKNLDGSDSSPSNLDHYNKKERRRSSSRRRRRMKMAYVLKEADSVTHPAERVRTLWKRGDSDPEPVLVPPQLALPPPSVKTVRAEESSCARIRVYEVKTRRKRMRKGHVESCDHTLETSKKLKPKDVRLKPSRRKDPKTKPASDPVQPTPPEPKPSKRLTIMAECKWARVGDRHLVLKMLCEAMAEDQLDQPLWIGDYLVTPISHTVEDGAADRCIHYKMHISRPTQEKPPQQRQQEPLKRKFEEAEPLQEWQREVEAEPLQEWQREVEAEPPEEWQREVEAEPLEEWQREVEAEPLEWQREVEAEPLEEWQREVEAEPLEEWQREVEAEPLEEWQREVEAEPLEEWQREVEAEPLEEWQREVEAEPLEEWQREVDVELPEEWQREVEEGDIKEEKEEKEVGEGSTDNLSCRKEIISKRKSMVSMALPFLTGVSPAGFLSANRKQLGETDHLVQVNGKLYPLAKIQLGKMGALHPANRLAAYLTGRVGSNGKHRGSSSSKPPNNQSAGPTSPPAPFVAPTPPPRSQPSVTMPTSLPAPPADSRVSSSVAPPVNPPPKGAVLLLQVPVPPGKLPSPVRAPCAPPPPSSTSQMMFLRPVRSKTGVLYYRRPDGQLVQLVPISKLNPVNKNRTFVQRIFPPVSLQAPVDNQTTPWTAVTSIPLPSSASSPLHPGFVAPVGGGTIQILSDSSRNPIALSCPNAHSRAAPPMSPVSLKPSASGGAALGVKAVTVSPAPGGGTLPAAIETCPGGGTLPAAIETGPGGGTLQAPIETGPGGGTLQAPIETGPGGGTLQAPIETGPGGGTLQAPIETGPGRGTLQAPVETGPGGGTLQAPIETGPGRGTLQAPIETGPGGGTLQAPVESGPGGGTLQAPIETGPGGGTLQAPVESGPGGGTLQAPVETGPGGGTLPAHRPSSHPPESVPPSEVSEGGTSGTENSSNSEDELDSKEGKSPSVELDEREKWRHLHNHLEKRRRRDLFQRFEGLRKEVGLVEEKTPKIVTLNTAVEVIQLLKRTNSDLEKKKNRLMKRRDKYLSFILGERSDKLSEGGDTGSSDTGSSDTGSSDTGSSDTGRSDTGSSDTGSSDTGSSDTGSSDTDLMEAVDLLDSSDEFTEESDKERVVATATKAEDEGRQVAMETAEESCRPTVAQRAPASNVSNVDSESSLRLASSFRGLREVMKTTCNSEGLLLDQARQEIQTLHSELARLTSMKTCLRQQRNTFIRDVSLRSGKSPLTICRDVQNSSTCQRKMEGERSPMANQPPAETDYSIPTSDLRQLQPQAPPTTECFQGPQSILSVSNPVLAPPDVSHDASLASDRPRTFPNILSRHRNPAVSSSLPALIPQRIRSLVRCALPGQQVLPVSPLQTSPAPGMTTVTLNLSNLTNQQICLTSMPRPPIAANFNVLPGFQPSSTVRRILPFPQIILQPQILQPPQQILLHPQPMPAPPPPPQPSLLVSVGSDQEQPGASAARPGPPVTVGGPLGAEDESLTSLLDELFFLNQQNSSSEEAGPAALTETTRDETQLPPAVKKSDALAPPPLLQMKVGGATLVDAPGSDLAAGRKEGGGGGWRREGGVAWRPMPRLVPLGLRGNPS